MSHGCVRILKLMCVTCSLKPCFPALPKAASTGSSSGPCTPQTSLTFGWVAPEGESWATCLADLSLLNTPCTFYPSDLAKSNSTLFIDLVVFYWTSTVYQGLDILWGRNGRLGNSVLQDPVVNERRLCWFTGLRRVPGGLPTWDWAINIMLNSVCGIRNS